LFNRKQIRLLAGLLGIASGTVGSTCVIVEEGPGAYEEPGINDETMYEQEEEIVEESNR
jgi:hypothetical protein